MDLLDAGDQTRIVCDYLRTKIADARIGRDFPADSSTQRFVVVTRDASVHAGNPRTRRARFRFRVSDATYPAADLLARDVINVMEGVQRHDYIISARIDLGPFDADDPSWPNVISMGAAVAWRTN